MDKIYCSSNTEVEVTENRYAAQRKKTALYCRSAADNENAIKSQKEQLLRCVNKKGLTNLSWYIDNGASGNTLIRPAMIRLIADIKFGEISAVVVTSADRISRNMIALSEWVRFARENDVLCVSADTDERELDNELELLFDNPVNID